MKIQGNNLERLHVKLEEILKKQEALSWEIINIREELAKLQPASKKKDLPNEIATEPLREDMPHYMEIPAGTSGPEKSSPERDRRNIERFIGENLINKIGIVILVAGISIGVKYAIDHELISPLMRIVLGYFAGTVLALLAWRLKKKYINYSAVLLSGAMASMYFITYAAFAYYDLFPRWVTFGIMIFFTLVTVLSALHYDRQVIAHIGLIGAYAIPFLLSDPETNISFLFAYMVLINTGILFISWFKYWKYLAWLAFLCTWLIYFQWYIPAYGNVDSWAGFPYAAIFFVLFHAIVLLYKLAKQKIYSAEDIIFFLANSVVFFGIGFSLLESQASGEKFSGLFTLINALIHAAIAYVLLIKKPADQKIFYYAASLAVVFVTIAIPVQLDGSWVTLLWAGEAVLLFWASKRGNVKIWQILSFMILVLAFFSLLHDWKTVERAADTTIVPLLNTSFLVAMVFCSLFAFILWIDRTLRQINKPETFDELERIFSLVVSGIFLIVLFLSFYREISLHWDQLIQKLSPETDQQMADENRFGLLRRELLLSKNYWLINYSIFFTALFSSFNLFLLKERNTGTVNLLVNTGIIILILSAGLMVLSGLRENYINQLPEGGSFLKILYRYPMYALLGGVIYLSWRTIREYFNDAGFKVVAEFAFHLILIIVLSSELIHWMDFSGSAQSNKLGLSILWGVYSLGLILLGIFKGKKYLRILAIVFFFLTLLKLFFYDLADMDTVSKTVIFLVLGTLLMIISFLYNKYKHLILD
jgi:uncharacterized membrane protein